MEEYKDNLTLQMNCQNEVIRWFSFVTAVNREHQKIADKFLNKI